jgi:ABC-2 type transport system permease protein
VKVLAIAGTSLRRLVRDRTNIFFVFVLPMLLILALGAAFGGDFDPRIGIVAVDVGELGEDLATRLENVGGIDISYWEEREELVRGVERGKLEAGVMIPAGYDDALRSGEPVTIEFVARPDASAQALRNTIESVVTEQGSLLRAAAFAEAEGAISFSDALESATDVEADLVGLRVGQRAIGEPFPLDELGRFELGAYSQLLLFIFITSTTSSVQLIQSRRLGVSRRMLSTATPVSTILIGEALGRFAVAMLQGLFIMLGSSLAFGVSWGDPVGAAAILTAFSLVAAGVGMLMGAVFKNEQQAGGVGVLLGIGLAAIGGSMVPLAIMRVFSPTLYRVAHVSPHAWGIEAYEELILRGGTVADILPELVVLSAFAVVMLVLATIALRRSLTH